MFKHRPLRAAGFTLMELVIVMGLLAFLTINIAVNIQNAFRARARIQVKLEDFSRVRDSLRIIERDFNLAFHYRDLEEEFREAVTKAGSPQVRATPTPPPGFGGPPPTQQPGASTDPRDIERKKNKIDPVTQFVGSEDKVDFVTSNTARLSSSQVQGDFVEVGYALKSCRRPGSEVSVQCLVRRESSLVEGKVAEGGSTTVLLEDVSEFKLRYFGQGKQDWNTDWNSEQAEASTQSNYPQAVEISLTVERGEAGKTRKVSMQIVAAVRFPNNTPKEGQSQTPGTGIPGI